MTKHFLYAGVASMALGAPAMAQTEVEFWHAFTGRLGELVAEQRDCIVLAYCEGYTHQELSQRLTRPIGTVKSWIRRGLHLLKDCIER